MVRTERGQLGSFIAIIFIISLFAVAIYLSIQPTRKIEISNAYPDNTELSLGGSTKINVKIKNVSDGEMAFNVSVTVTPSNPSVIGADSVSIGNLDSGEERWLFFPISIVQNARYGKYKIKVSTSAAAPFEGDTKDVYITVK